MREITIGFSRARNPWLIGSQIIQIAEKRKFSHVFVGYKDELTAEMMIGQASHGLVNETNRNLFVQVNDIIEEFTLRCTEQQYLDVIRFIKLHLGLPYSNIQLVFIAIKKLFHVELNYHNKNAAFICSELGDKICEILDITDDIDADYETPSDLNTLLKSKINI